MNYLSSKIEQAQIYKLNCERGRFFSAVLIIDNSTPSIFIALCYRHNNLSNLSNYEVLYEKSFHTKDASHGLLQEVQFLQKQYENEFSQIEAIVLGVGPGSYTGLRSAFSIAAGIARAKKISLWPVSSLVGFSPKLKKALCCFDARAGGLYAQAFINHHPLTSAIRIPKQEIVDWINQEYQLISPNADDLNLEYSHSIFTPRPYFIKRQASALVYLSHFLELVDLRLKNSESASFNGFIAGCWQNGFIDFKLNYLKKDEDVAKKMQK